MILAKLSGLLPCRFMQLLLHSCFNSSYSQKSHCWPVSTFAAWQVKGVCGHKRWLVPQHWLLSNTMILVLSRYPTLSLQSIQGVVGRGQGELGIQALPEVGEWAKQGNLTFLKEKGSAILQVLQIWHRGGKRHWQPKIWKVGKAQQAEPGNGCSLPPPSSVPAALLHSMAPHWSFRAR